MPKAVGDKKVRRRKPTPYQTLSGRLTAYSVTAGAAALCASGAHATITKITNANLLFEGTAVSLSHPPTFSFSALAFGAHATLTLASPFHTLQFHGFGSGSHTGFASLGDAAGGIASVGGGIAEKLGSGATIGGVGRNFAALGALAAAYSGNGKGQFQSPNGTGYIGFKAGASYGWLKVAVGSMPTGLP